MQDLEGSPLLTCRSDQKEGVVQKTGLWVIQKAVGKGQRQADYLVRHLQEGVLLQTKDQQVPAAAAAAPPPAAAFPNASGRPACEYMRAYTCMLCMYVCVRICVRVFVCLCLASMPREDVLVFFSM